MEPAEIDVEAACLRRRGWPRHAGIPFDHVRRIESTRLASLADEIGLVMSANDEQVFVRETDPGFAALVARFDLEGRWGPQWYARSEAGERFAVDL